MVDITYDAAKDARNIRERGLSFDRAADFDFDTAAITIDQRHDYGEIRLVAVGHIDRRLHVLCYIETATGFRVISLRRANSREIKKYAKTKAPDW